MATRFFWVRRGEDRFVASHTVDDSGKPSWEMPGSDQGVLPDAILAEVPSPERLVDDVRAWELGDLCEVMNLIGQWIPARVHEAHDDHLVIVERTERATHWLFAGRRNPIRGIGELEDLARVRRAPALRFERFDPDKHVLILGPGARPDASVKPSPAAPAGAETWLPIDSAPRDGRKILAWLGVGAAAGPFAVRWCPFHAEGEPDAGGWEFEDGSRVDPSYWWPIPLPPEGP